jgi:hypothetical protein
MMVSALHAQVLTCPAKREGKNLTGASFFEWTTDSPTRTMADDRTPLAPAEARAEGDDWFQSWNVTHAISGYGLQMVCQYQCVKAGLFIEVAQKVSICTLTKKSGVAETECK